jgi:hypothetical protein
MGDYKPNHPSILLYESYYPRAEIRFNLAQTATEIRGKSETKLPPAAGVMNHSMRARGETVKPFAVFSNLKIFG